MANTVYTSKVVANGESALDCSEIAVKEKGGKVYIMVYDLRGVTLIHSLKVSHYKNAEELVIFEGNVKEIYTKWHMLRDGTLRSVTRFEGFTRTVMAFKGSPGFVRGTDPAYEAKMRAELAST